MPIGEGLKYLGFHLKPVNYKAADWSWIADRFYRKITSWESRCLSIGGCATLALAVLVQIMVFWALLFYIQSSVINCLNSMISNYIWGGHKEKTKFHLCRLEKLSCPKSMGGWGLMNLQSFRRALLCKTMWNALSGESLWSKTVRAKYLYGHDIIYWYRQSTFGANSGSIIWRGFKRMFPFVRKNLIWNFHSGSKIIIGIDDFAGMSGPIHISPSLLRHLHNKGYFFWASVIKIWDGNSPIWKSAVDLNLPRDLASQWNDVTRSLNFSGIYRTMDNDNISWRGLGGSFVVSAKHIYHQILLSYWDSSEKTFPQAFWKTGCPTKIIIFAWLVFYDRNLTWENLQKRQWHGPAICSLCGINSENNLHIFLQCPQSKKIWQLLATQFGFDMVNTPTICDAFYSWSNMRCMWRPLPLVTIWTIWRWRNRIIFEAIKDPIYSIYESILSLFEAIARPQQPTAKQRRMLIHNDLYDYPIAFFDGAAQRNNCVYEIHIIPEEGQSYDIYWNGGPGTNSKAEIMALAGIIAFSDFLGIKNLHIYGDSKVTIDHVLSKIRIRNIHLSGWLNRIMDWWRTRTGYNISHIPRGKNQRADFLSKQGLTSPSGIWRLQINVDNCACKIQDFSITGTHLQIL